MKDMEEIYKAYALPVKKYVLSLCKNNALADDITADTFCKAVKNIDSFREGRMLTWLCAIAKNTYLDYIGRKEYQNLSLSDGYEAALSGVGSSPEEEYIKKDDRLTLYRQMQRLSPELKDVVYLRIFAGLSFKEIGNILGKSENWARVTFYRSKEKLKGWMENEI